MLSTPPFPLPSHAPRRGRARPLGWGQRGRAHPSIKGHAARARPHHFMGTPRLEGTLGGPQPLCPYPGRGQDPQPPHPPYSPHHSHEHDPVFLLHKMSPQLGGFDGHLQARGLIGVGVDGHAVVHGVAQQLLAGLGPAGETPGYGVTLGTGTKTPSPQPHRRQDKRPSPQLHSRGVVGQVQGAGTRGGLGHHVQLLRSWRKKGEKGQALHRGDTAGQDTETHPDLSG